MHSSRPTTHMCLVIALLVSLSAMATPAHANEPYPSSVVGTDFDFIHSTDPSAYRCLEYKGQASREMPDKTGPSELRQQAFVFVSYYDDGTQIDMAIDIDFKTQAHARAEALRYTPRLGKLPTSLRRGVKRVVVHVGDATAFSDEGLIVLYSKNATKRIATHDLEETVFHESIHAAWDKQHASSPAWLAAQASDDAFITRYAKKNPKGEDLAESALFAYTLTHHPDRIPVQEAAAIRSTIPARIAFVRTLLPRDQPIFSNIGPAHDCDEAVAEPTRDPPAVVCDVDVSRVGTLSDILSNALMRGLHQPESRVSAFLANAHEEYQSAEALIKATSKAFGFDEATLNAQVQAFLHCNCAHGELNAPQPARATAVAPTSPTPDVRTPSHVVTPPGNASSTPAKTDDVYDMLRVIAVLLLLILLVNVASLWIRVRRSS